MRAYIFKRLLYAIPTLIGISILVFAITRLSPGDPIRLYTFGALNVTEEDIQGLRAYYGLDEPSTSIRQLGEQGDPLDFGSPCSTTVRRSRSSSIASRRRSSWRVTALLLQLLIGVPLGGRRAQRGTWGIDNGRSGLRRDRHAIPTFWIVSSSS